MPWASLPLTTMLQYYAMGFPSPVDMPLNKETKPNQTSPYYNVAVLCHGIPFPFYQCCNTMPCASLRLITMLQYYAMGLPSPYYYVAILCYGIPFPYFDKWMNNNMWDVTYKLLNFDKSLFSAHWY